VKLIEHRHPTYLFNGFCGWHYRAFVQKETKKIKKLLNSHEYTGWANIQYHILYKKAQKVIQTHVLKQRTRGNTPRIGCVCCMYDTATVLFASLLPKMSLKDSFRSSLIDSTWLVKSSIQRLPSGITKTHRYESGPMQKIFAT